MSTAYKESSFPKRLTPLFALRDRCPSAITVPAECARAIPKSMLRGYLARVCRELDLRLDAPIAQTRMGQKRTVTVFRVLHYTMNPAAQSVECHVSAPGGQLPPRTFALDLWRPIRDGFWMPWLISDMGLFQPSPQRDLFEPDRDASIRWLANSAFRLLLRDPRFQALREVTLPTALRLDPQVVEMALRSSSSPLDPPLMSSLYTRVWCSKAAFVETSNENPQLLPLLDAWLQQRSRLSLRKTPVATIKRHFLREGISEAGWRYLCRHGTRLFRTLWELTPHVFPLKLACLYLRRLQQAGLPPPPSPALLRGWAAETDLYDDLYLEENWTPSLCVVFGIALREAARLKAANTYGHFLEEFGEVMAWARIRQPQLDKNQCRAGWPRLVRTARERLVSGTNKEPEQVWPSLVETFNYGSYEVVPLTDDVTLRAEANAMRNCLNLYMPDAVANNVRLFSIRQLGTGKRIANVELRYDARTARWVIVQVAARANRNAPPGINYVVREIGRRYSEAQSFNPLPEVSGNTPLRPGPPAEGIAHLLQEIGNFADDLLHDVETEADA